MKARAWLEYQHRAVSTPDGPMIAEKGDIVVVLVVPSWSEAFSAMQALLPKQEEKPGG